MPLEIKINETLDYIKIFTKADKILENYVSFGVDPSGNIHQVKQIQSSYLFLASRHING